MKKNNNEILSEMAEYYTSKLTKHGETPHGVDWNGKEGQTLRFEQLCKIIDSPNSFSINDLGCGYGSLYDYLDEKYKTFVYVGIDVSKAMIQAGNKRCHDKENVRFVVSSEPDELADYSVASGIFNVRLGRSDDEWFVYLKENLDILDRSCRLGFSFNCLTSYSDEEKIRDYLYYADPCVLFDLCKRRYSKNIALLHDYELYEFTILVRK